MTCVTLYLYMCKARCTNEYSLSYFCLRFLYFISACDPFVSTFRPRVQLWNISTYSMKDNDLLQLERLWVGQGRRPFFRFSLFSALVFCWVGFFLRDGFFSQVLLPQCCISSVVVFSERWPFLRVYVSSEITFPQGRDDLSLR